MASGRGSSLLVAGWVYHRSSVVRSVRLEFAGRGFEVDAHSMPRAGVFDAAVAEGAEHPLLAYRSGFWGILTFAGVAVGQPATLELVAEAADGSVFRHQITRVGLWPGYRDEYVPAASRPAGDHVAICMATYNPRADLLQRQVESIRRQSHTDWRCYISDDGSDERGRAALDSVIGDDPRFVVAAHEQRLGFYFNFGRALAMAPADSAYVALCDQDDEWHTEKLTRLVGAMRGGARLAFSDQRIVDETGTVVSDTHWASRANNYGSLSKLLSTNTVTGAASVFRRELLDIALPLPPRWLGGYHDHWVALCALATGSIAYVDEPLYDYRQYEGQVVGATRRRASESDRWEGTTGGWRNEWQLDYFALTLRRRWLSVLLLERARGLLAGRAESVLRRGAVGDRGSRGLLMAAGRAATELAFSRATIGHRTWELRGALWHRYAAARRGGPLPDGLGAVHHVSTITELGPEHPPGA